MVAAYVGLVALFSGVGAFVVANDWILVRDHEISRWFERNRTSALDTWSERGSLLADTFVKIAITALIAAALRVILRSWRDPAMIVLPLVLEASVFITVTTIVGRDRPSVEALESSPVASSFPSGHTAAAAVYGAMAVVLFWHQRNVIVRILSLVVAFALPLIVGLARVYRGMHHVSDVAFGALLGWISVAFCLMLIVRLWSPTPSLRPAPSHGTARGSSGIPSDSHR